MRIGRPCSVDTDKSWCLECTLVFFSAWGIILMLLAAIGVAFSVWLGWIS